MNAKTWIHWDLMAALLAALAGASQAGTYYVAPLALGSGGHREGRRRAYDCAETAEMISGYWGWPYRFARYRKIRDLWFLPDNER